MDPDGTFDMGITIPANAEQAISSGTELGLKIYELSQTVSLEMFERGAAPDLIDNCILHAHIVALSFMVAKMSISMKGDALPASVEEFIKESSPFQKNIVDAIHKMLVDHVRNGVFIKVDKTGGKS